MRGEGWRGEGEGEAEGGRWRVKVRGEVEGRKWRMVGCGGVWRERTRKGRGERYMCGGEGMGRKGVEEMRAVEE